MEYFLRREEHYEPSTVKGSRGGGPNNARGGGAPGPRAKTTPPTQGGFLAPSGPAAPSGTPTKLVAEMAVDQINKAGCINGRPLELIIGDTESDPAKAATIAKKFIHSDKVAAIIGPTATGEGMQVKKIVEAAGRPTLMT